MWKNQKPYHYTLTCPNLQVVCLTNCGLVYAGKGYNMYKKLCECGFRVKEGTRFLERKLCKELYTAADGLYGGYDGV